VIASFVKLFSDAITMDLLNQNIQAFPNGGWIYSIQLMQISLLLLSLLLSNFLQSFYTLLLIDTPIRSGVMYNSDRSTIKLGPFIVFCWLIAAPFLWVSIVVTVLNLLVYFSWKEQNQYQLSFVNFIYLFDSCRSFAVAAWSSHHMALKRNDDQK
jgi:hypothetical protein